ncbi:MAG TPA: TetR family transcriptional regulator C-terminal domain-containing protein [Steroidobacteraceae bacterium]
MPNVSSQRASTALAEHTADGGGSRIRQRQRQRQRLIDACISALHIYGPSRTTVEKVVALADLSPGIVRFYFDSKAAMLVASLEYLAAEFEERVMAPVARLKHAPVQALRLLVDLYLDADIASPRKVSVWYAFWGEASARQEYQDICGQKDDEFAALVRELIERLIAASGATHLDADGVALGLIGVLEVLWQGIAFESEANIDRAAAIARSLAYLRSVFPGEFASSAPNSPHGSGAPRRADALRGAGARLPAWAYADAALLAAERERLLRPAWQLLGHEAELRVAGDFFTGDLAGERAVVLRAERGKLHALRNTCRRRPHALLAARKGHLEGAVHCAVHGLTYGFDGRLLEGATPGDLAALEMRRQDRLILVRAGGAAAERTPQPLWEGFAALVPRAVADLDVAADWKVIVEQWLESPQPQQHFVAPNQLLDIRPAGALILQVVPSAPGRSRIRRFEFSAARAAGTRAVWRRQNAAWLGAQIELAESTQSGLMGAAEEPEDVSPVAPALAQFRALVAACLQALPAR